MIQDPNVERLIKQYVEPLKKKIAILEKKVKALESKPVSVIYKTNSPNQ